MVSFKIAATLMTLSFATANAATTVVKICQSPGLESCTDFEVENDKCTDFNDLWNDKIRSYKYDGESSWCWFYKDADCYTDVMLGSVEGEDEVLDLSEITKGDFDNQLSSIMCMKAGPETGGVYY